MAQVLSNGHAGRRIRRRGILAILGIAAIALGVAAPPGTGAPGVVRAATPNDVAILTGSPTTLDPALQGDAGSAAVTAQLFETLTAFDTTLTLRPALADSWLVSDSGRQITFTLRPDLTFSDGTRLTAADVVRSWLRLIDPREPSPLASLMDDVEGATAYRTGQATDPGSVGLRAADDRHVEVRLSRPAADFASIVAGPSFGIVPPEVGQSDAALRPGAFVGSGAYRLAASSASELTLQANDRYWAGTPAIKTVHLLASLQGRSPVDAFQAGDVDYTPISDYDASWIAYDRDLGPQLRAVPALDVTYYGFDARTPPFDDARVRKAFAEAVNWQRIVTLGGLATATPATSMVPPGVPGRSDRDFVPAYDPTAAKADLAAAGYPGGRGFPTITLVTGGTGYDQAIVTELDRVLGITVKFEAMPFGDYFDRLAADPPAFWALSWVADYPGPNDFLGLLLGTGQTNDYGRWSNADFDAAIARAGATSDPAQQLTEYEDAQSIVAAQVPVIPVSYDAGWALSRDGLLGAGQNGLGILRMAGLAWQR